MTTKKQFIQTAKIISAIESKEQRKKMFNEFSKTYQAENPRFDIVKFKKACNVSDDCGAFKSVEAELLAPNGIKIGW